MHRPEKPVTHPDPGYAAQDLHLWIGASGKSYRYTAFMYGTQFGPGAGNLIFAREVRRGQYAAICVAQTADLSEPFGDPATLGCIREGRPTHVHVHFAVGDEAARLAECEDLIAALKPACNLRRATRPAGLVADGDEG
jgi:hypothetical protein